MPENEEFQKTPPMKILAVDAAAYASALIEHLDEDDDVAWASNREHTMVHVAALCDHFVALARGLEDQAAMPNSLLGTPLEEIFD